MGTRNQVFLLVVFFQISLIAASQTDNGDFIALKSLKDAWHNTPPSWGQIDPCGENWVGINCTESRVTSITLSSMGLEGQLTGDISTLSELQILDLSSNKGLNGSLPSSIGNLKKLTTLNLIGCSFSGHIPESIGSLPQLVVLYLNGNRFSGAIPPTIGNLTNLYLLDITDNQLEGPIPVSNGTTPGLDMLVRAKHFHFGNNKLSGPIPSQLFSSNMTLIHVLLDSNQLSGSIPSTLVFVKTLEVLRLDRNSLGGFVPSNFNNLTSLQELYLSNNKLSGPLPNLTGLNSLNYLDLSNNSLDTSDVPSWFSTVQSLTTLMMEDCRIQGEVPVSLFGLPNLETVVLRRNYLNGTLDIGTSHSDQLKLIDFQNNLISAFTQRPRDDKFKLILAGNPICDEIGQTKSYCTTPEVDSSPYMTPPNNCIPAPCSADQVSSPNCRCAFPYTGTLIFRAPSFSNLGNKTYYVTLEQFLMNSIQLPKAAVDSVSLRNPRKNPFDYLELTLELFPSGQDSFNRTIIFEIGFILSNHNFEPSEFFGNFYFKADAYKHFSGESLGSHKSTSIYIVIGAAVGVVVLLLLLLLFVGIYAYCQKKRAKSATEQNPFANWESSKSSGSIPQLKGARFFSFEEVKKYTNNFLEGNEIGTGGYGKVYRGTLPDGQLIAIKRAQQGSTQGGLEFKTEIELLSRVHHKNVVSLIGFCFEQGDQMLIYEYITNGNLRDCLSGKTGINLDWMRRLKVILGAARGLAYLHELASPSIIHRDIKSTNILLDEHLNAKVADFGLSKLASDGNKAHVSTQVKGTMGYLDPEYFMTQQLTEKSDVFSFGVLMLELITARRPLEQGQYIVRVVRIAMDRTKELYNLHEILDQKLELGPKLKGLEKFVDLAMNCVQESGVDRPTMGEVVKVIENIMQVAGLNPNAESTSTSPTSDQTSKGISFGSCDL
ncbi:probable leucine-rich repeat receptor-like protein kinase At5g49770 [Tripterygium wilfordii]|nr:probable leucine-rich repeat receptor-like protein kinase At5g49770 [Tripterygium wilfordii]